MKNQSKSLLFIVALAIIISSCASQKQKEQTISLSGAFAIYPLVVKWAEEYQKENPNIRFNISAGGAGKGMADALSGAVDLGMFSREISEEEIAQGVWWAGLCIDAVLPTISANNPYIETLKAKGLTQQEFKDIFMNGKTKNWGEILGGIPEAKSLVVYTRSDACGAAGTWAAYLGAQQEDIQGIGIYGDPGLAEAVATDPVGIGFNNTIFIYDIKTGKKHAAIDVVPIDINENDTIDPEENFYDSFDAILQAIADSKYPSPPARELYFVSKGKPTKHVTLDFIKWTLTDGQKYVKESGYVPISEQKIKAYLDILN